MGPLNNSMFTEEQRSEAYRVEHMAQVMRQTKALESIRSYVGWLLGIVLFGIVVSVIVGIVAAQPY